MEHPIPAGPIGESPPIRGSTAVVRDVASQPRFRTLLTSEWYRSGGEGEPLDAEAVLTGAYRGAVQVWDLDDRTHRQSLGGDHSDALIERLQPAHNPTRAYGFAAEVLSPGDRSASLLLWYLDRSVRGAHWSVRSLLTLPARPAAGGCGPATPPLLTDLQLSADDRFLYLACAGTGQLRQYDVSDPFAPRLTAMILVGDAAEGAAGKLRGGPRELRVSDDGRWVYLTNLGRAPWDAVTSPGAPGRWLARVAVGSDGGMRLDEAFLVELAPGSALATLDLDRVTSAMER